MILSCSIFHENKSPISLTLDWQVTTSIAKISVDATPSLSGDIKKLLIKILLSPAEYVPPCHITLYEFLSVLHSQYIISFVSQKEKYVINLLSTCTCYLNMPFFVSNAHSFLCFFFLTMLRLSFRKLGWDPKKGESHLDVMLRPLLLIALVQLGHDKTINEGVRRFNIFTHNRNTPLLPPDTRKVLAFAITSSGAPMITASICNLCCSAGCIPRCDAECY